MVDGGTLNLPYQPQEAVEHHIPLLALAANGRMAKL
jgi:hypothetical protein